MASTSITPNMNLPLPVVGVQTGPQYAINLNDCLTIVDTHNHTPGYGVQIPSGGLNINADLPFSNNNLTTVRTTRFQSQSAALGAAADIGCLYEVLNDLYFNDGAGNQVRITQGGSVTGASGTITGLPSGTAGASYSSVSSTFIFQSATLTPAYIDGASIIIRNLSASSKGLTLAPPAAMAADYTLNLPPLPASQKIMTLDASGNITAPYTVDGSTITIATNVIGVPNSGIGTAQIANSAVTTAKISNLAVTNGKLDNSAVDLNKLASDVLAFLVPTGTILPYGGTTAPTGFLLCDGSSVNRTTFAALFAVISSRFGTADGSHFNVPDLQGRFLRGWDNGAGRDPGPRTAMNAGGNTGDNIGSIEADAFASHTHTGNATNGLGSAAVIQLGNVAGTTYTIGATGGSETRPINANVNFIIKT